MAIRIQLSGMALFTTATTWARQRKARLIFATAFLVAVALVMTRPQQIPVEYPEKAWNVEAIGVVKTSIRPTLELFGAVLSPQDSSLGAAIEGEIVEVAVLDGQTVDAGQMLVLLDARDEALTLAEREAELQELDAQLQLAQRRLARSRESAGRESELLTISQSKARRAQELFNDRLISEADVETTQENLKRQQLAVNQGELAKEEAQLNIRQLEAQLARARAQRDRAKLNVDRARITAPFSGIVSELKASIGDRTRPGDILMRLQNPATVEVRTQVPGRYAAAIGRGMDEGLDIPAQVEVEGNFYAGQLTRLAGRTREGSGGVDSFIQIDKPPLGLRLGSTVRILVELPVAEDAVAVPAEALYGQNRLYRIVDSRMDMLTVERLGERVGADGRTEVIVRSEDLKDQDRIVVTKLSNAFDGLLVTLTNVDNSVQLTMPDIGQSAGPSTAVELKAPPPN